MSPNLLKAASANPPDWPTLLDLLQTDPRRVASFTFPLDQESPQAGRGLLHVAATCGKDDYAELLINRGADPCLHDLHGETPLHCASRHGKRGCAEVILRADPAALSEVDVDRWTPLHSAAEEGHEHIALLLMSMGARVNARCSQGGTPLFLAAMEGHDNMVNLLLHAGAWNYKAYFRDTPADIAEKHGHTELASQLFTYFSGKPAYMSEPDQHDTNLADRVDMMDETPEIPCTDRTID